MGKLIQGKFNKSLKKQHTTLRWFIIPVLGFYLFTILALLVIVLKAL
jgi:hypothetical protein